MVIGSPVSQVRRLFFTLDVDNDRDTVKRPCTGISEASFTALEKRIVCHACGKLPPSTLVIDELLRIPVNAAELKTSSDQTAPERVRCTAAAGNTFGPHTSAMLTQA